MLDNSNILMKSYRFNSSILPLVVLTRATSPRFFLPENRKVLV
jgi:hypothetical protein